jgi:hypothetical protein
VQTHTVPALLLRGRLAAQPPAVINVINGHGPSNGLQTIARQHTLLLDGLQDVS